MNIHAPGEALRRREEILRIVRETSVASQDELLRLLGKRGYALTQPTLSRDVRELGLIKTPNGYMTPQAMAAGGSVAAFAPRERLQERLEQLFRDSVIFAQAAGNLVVIKTPVAAAQPLASALDTTPNDDILGTIGGDDTIFIAFTTPAAASSFARRIHEIAGLHGFGRRTTRA